MLVVWRSSRAGLWRSALLLSFSTIHGTAPSRLATISAASGSRGTCQVVSTISPPLQLYEWLGHFHSQNVCFRVGARSRGLVARLARKSQRAAPPGEAIRALSTYRRVRGLLSQRRRASRSLCRCATKLAHERALADDIMPCADRARADVPSRRNVAPPSPAAGPSPAAHPPARFTDLTSPLSTSLEMWRQP